MIAQGTGTPNADGIYCAEVYFGWKILEFRDGAWEHIGIQAKWTATPPVQWVGPLVRVADKMDFDL